MGGHDLPPLGVVRLNNIMVDIETTGLDPVHSNIIQIAAVRFDLETKSVDYDMFDACLSAAPGPWWDEGTRDWWMGDEKWPIFQTIAHKMRPPEMVLKEFQEWVLKLPTAAPVRFWAKPTTFDFPFVSSYFKQFEIDFPFHYRYAVDLNSYILGRGHSDNKTFWDAVAPVGDAHNALHDVLYQIRGVFQA